MNHVFSHNFSRVNIKMLLFGIFVIFGLLFLVVPTDAFAQLDSSNLTTVGDESILPATNIIVIIAKIIRAVLGVLGIVTVILILYSGALIMFSKGESVKVIII